MKDELDSLAENNTWVLVKRSVNARILKNRWVFRVKEENNGNVRYKARLVAVFRNQESTTTKLLVQLPGMTP